MLLVIDVGNTNMVFGVFDGDKLIANWRLSTQSGRTADETGLMIRNLFQYSDVSVSDIEAVIVSSVVPNVMYSTLNGIKKFHTKADDAVAEGDFAGNRRQPARKNEKAGKHVIKKVEVI